jgi:hypothetical protein
LKKSCEIAGSSAVGREAQLTAALQLANAGHWSLANCNQLAVPFTGKLNDFATEWLASRLR